MRPTQTSTSCQTISIIVIATALFLSTPSFGQPPGPLPDGCYTIRAPYISVRYPINGYLTHNGAAVPAYHANRSAAGRFEKFYLSNRVYNHYLIFGEDKKFISAAQPKVVLKSGVPGDTERWQIHFLREDHEGKRYAIKSIPRDTWLSAERNVVLLGVVNTKPERGAWEEWYIAPAEGCARLPDVDINTTVEVKPAPGKPLFGIADLHGHMFTNESFGGLAFYGEPFHQNGLARAMHWCNLAHGEGGVLDPIGNFLNGTFGHSPGGSPEFNSWPKWNSANHQQMYYRWVERAFRAGLRLQTLLAVNNEVLCGAYRVLRRAPRGCDDMPSVDSQLAAARHLEAFIDREHGGPGKGWFRIAHSGQEARQIIESGKMAVVLGIEVSALFGGKQHTNLHPQYIREQLDKYYALGVRHVFPVHVFDNAFGGAALYNPLFTVGNKVANGKYFEVEDCERMGYPGIEYNANLGITEKLLSLLGTAGFPNYPSAKGHCNRRGLTSLGQVLIQEMMARKMIIDVDHMGARTLEGVLNLVEPQDYPVVRGHTSFTEQGIGQARSETIPNAVERIRDLGGLVAPIFHQSKVSSRKPHGPVAHDCDESSKSWAQAYSFAVDKMKGAAVPLGSDMNGWIHQPSPRFGDDACAKNKEQAAAQNHPVIYPFNAHGVPGTFGRLRSADRVFDYNTDGFANIGLLPDFIQDLKNVGLSDEDLKPLFSSAEAYVTMWEKIDGK